jgi:hypothetical protein
MITVILTTIAIIAILGIIAIGLYLIHDNYKQIQGYCKMAEGDTKWYPHLDPAKKEQEILKEMQPFVKNVKKDKKSS